eukprot:TRINITY_DN16744_c0_g1_i1.p1 TRINITY_DN16744_c0_g1~~TRINITY_DN16744_c0_g1_i1.p1  ORF type:complete len:514 (+),score=112.97 TRINITY_DN16744_c0_g1_i1:94-1542(+)
MAEDSTCKIMSFWIVGVITLVYCFIELGFAMYLNSLTLLSDGFHNLSDVISLYIAYWAAKAAKRGSSDEMTFGWVRTEILGALCNGLFLVSLSVYISLEAIPLFIEPKDVSEMGGYAFIGVAAAGLVVNTVGTGVFMITGQSHGHSHAGGGGHGHSHGGGDDHGHGHGDHGHGHGAEKEEEGEEPRYYHVEDQHMEEVGLLRVHTEQRVSKDGTKKKQKKKVDMNVHAVFLHYLGDMISSCFVLITGILIHIFGSEWWAEYLDPTASLFIVALIIYTTLPLVKRCCLILLQSTPDEINVDEIRDQVIKVSGVVNAHDLHVWALSEGMIIATIHCVCEEGVDFGRIVKQVKQVFHEHGIHSTAIQPEFVPVVSGLNHDDSNVCLQNCVEECKEDWCCQSEVPPEVDHGLGVSGHGHPHGDGDDHGHAEEGAHGHGHGATDSGHGHAHGAESGGGGHGHSHGNDGGGGGGGGGGGVGGGGYDFI